MAQIYLYTVPWGFDGLNQSRKCSMKGLQQTASLLHFILLEIELMTCHKK